MDRNAPAAEVMLAVFEGLGERFGGSSPYLLVAGLGQMTWTGCATELLGPRGGVAALTGRG